MQTHFDGGQLFPNRHLHVLQFVPFSGQTLSKYLRHEHFCPLHVELGQLLHCNDEHVGIELYVRSPVFLLQLHSDVDAA